MKNLLKKILYFFEPQFYFNWHYIGHKKSVSELRKIVSNKKVLVIGSGPSASDLFLGDNDDIVIGCCNFSFKYVPANHHANIFMTTSYALREKPEISDVFSSKNRLDWVGINLPSTIIGTETSKVHTRQARNILPFRSLLDLDTLIEKRIPMIQQGQYYFFSTGVQMVLLCLLAGAKEIYVAGIDIDQEVIYANGAKYNTDPKIKINKHQYADMYAMQEIKNKNLPVFSLIKDSPLSQLIDHRTIN